MASMTHRRIGRGALVALALASALVGTACSRRKPVVLVLPPIPMDEASAVAAEPASSPDRSVAPATSEGGCRAADSLGTIAADTVSLADLPQPPRLLVQPPTVYPPSERSQGWEGTVDIRLLVRPDGYVSRADVGNGGDPFLQAAAAAACRTRFAPVRSASGEPAYVWITQGYSFSLRPAVPAGRRRR